MSVTRRALAALATAVLLTGVAAAPAPLSSSAVMYPTFRFCDYIPFFPGCQR